VQLAIPTFVLESHSEFLFSFSPLDAHPPSQHKVALAQGARLTPEGHHDQPWGCQWSAS